MRQFQCIYGRNTPFLISSLTLVQKKHETRRKMLQALEGTDPFPTSLAKWVISIPYESVEKHKAQEASKSWIRIETEIIPREL